MTTLPLRRFAGRALITLIAAVGFAVAGLGGAGPALAGSGTNYLATGEILPVGQSLQSDDGQYQLTMQGDGNLVLYAPGHRAAWSTGTSSPGSYLGMQGDGNLVVYAPGPHAVWASGTSGPNLHLEVQKDGNSVVYDSGHAAKWAASGVGSADHANLMRVQYNAYVQMRDAGWSDSEWPCLNNLYVNESSWRWNATNGQAYGIPQANPGTKMGTVGADWHDNTATELKWGLQYIRDHGYGSPCGAWSYWQNHHSY